MDQLVGLSATAAFPALWDDSRSSLIFFFGGGGRKNVLALLPTTQVVSLLAIFSFCMLDGNEVALYFEMHPF